MEPNTEKANFDFAIPYNHPILVNERKKAKIKTSIFLIIAAAFITAGAVFVTSLDMAPVAVLCIFYGVAVFMWACAVWSLFGFKARGKDNQRKMRVIFWEDSVTVAIDNTSTGGKMKILTSCRYGQRAGVQYVAGAGDFSDKIQICVMKGMIRNMQNGVTASSAPVYTNYSIPKDILAAGEEDSLKTFLKAKLGANFKTEKQ